VSAAAFRLKGGGWYETDFKTGSKKNLHGAAESAGAAGSEGKQESKKETKKESKSDGSSKA
jgi:predicted nucleic acid-binding Zn ribbon protein